MVDGSIVVCGRIGKDSVGVMATEVASWFVPVGTMVFVGVSVDKLDVQLVNQPVRRNNIWTCKICFFTFTSFWFDCAKNRPTVCVMLLRDTGGWAWLTLIIRKNAQAQKPA